MDPTPQPAAPRDGDGSERGGLQRIGDWFKDLIVTWGPAILLVLLVRSLFFEPFRIPSGSMVPTLAIGDHILVTKYSYGWRWPLTREPIGALDLPERGDIIVFAFPGSDMDPITGEPGLGHWLDVPIPGIVVDYVKRVVALPGDIVEVRDNVLILNGQIQPMTAKGEFEFIDDRCDPFPTTLQEEALGNRAHAALTTRRYAGRMPDFGPYTVPEGHVFAMGDNRDHSADSRVWGPVPLRNIKGKARFVWLSYDQCQPGIPLLGRIRTERMGLSLR